MSNRIVALAAALLATTVPAHAQSRESPAVSPARPSLVLVCPDLFVGTIDSRQEQAANPEWTRAAYANLIAALKDGPVGRSVDLRVPPCVPEETTPLRDRTRAEVNWLESDIIFKVPAGTFPLPDNDMRRIKGLKGKYSYRLSAALLADLRAACGDADYALFLAMHDAYTTPGAKAGKIAAAFLGVANTMPPHFANSLLIDFRTGDMVWWHGDGQIGGDVRTAAGAQKRIEEALHGFALPPK